MGNGQELGKKFFESHLLHFNKKGGYTPPILTEHIKLHLTQ